MAQRKTKKPSLAKKVDNSPFYQKWWFWLIIAFLVIGGIGSIFNPKDDSTSEGNKTVERTEPVGKTDSLEFLRKCTVMEAADIYETGIGGDRNSAFDDALKSCQEWEREWDDFEEVIELDWENRKSETIEEKPLSYYLEKLGW